MCIVTAQETKKDGFSYKSEPFLIPHLKAKPIARLEIQVSLTLPYSGACVEAKLFGHLTMTCGQAVLQEDFHLPLCEYVGCSKTLQAW